MPGGFLKASSHAAAFCEPADQLLHNAAATIAISVHNPSDMPKMNQPPPHRNSTEENLEPQSPAWPVFEDVQFASMTSCGSRATSRSTGTRVIASRLLATAAGQKVTGSVKRGR